MSPARAPLAAPRPSSQAPCRVQERVSLLMPLRALSFWAELLVLGVHLPPWITFELGCVAVPAQCERRLGGVGGVGRGLGQQHAPAAPSGSTRASLAWLMLSYTGSTRASLAWLMLSYTRLFEYRSHAVPGAGRGTGTTSSSTAARHYPQCGPRPVSIFFGAFFATRLPPARAPSVVARVMLLADRSAFLHC
jgi:hypothetical protein